MLVLFCVKLCKLTTMNPVGKKKKQLFSANKQNICKIAKTKEIFNLKNLGDKIHKLIIKEVKLNINLPY